MSKHFPYILLSGILLCLFISACSSGPQTQKALPPPTAETPATVKPPAEVQPTPLTPPAEAESTSAVSLMDIAPADALFVLQLKDTAGALSLIEDSTAWQQLTAAPVWELFWAVFEMETEVKDFQRLLRPSLSAVSHLLGQEILIIVPKFQGILEVSPTVLIRLNRSDDLGEILTSGLEVALANIPEVTTREYGGYSYLVTEPLGANRRLACGIADDILIASLGEATLRKVIDLYQGKSDENLANDADFSQRMARFQTTSGEKTTDFQAMYYIDISTVSQFLELMYPMARGEIPEEMQPLADQAIKWLDLVQSVTGISNLTADGVLAQSYVQLNPDATADNFRAMLQTPPTTHNSIQFAPADSAGYGASNLIDLPKLWEMAMEILKSLPDETGEELRNGLKNIQTQLGFNIEEDLLSWMGNEIAVINRGNLIRLPGDETEGAEDTQTMPQLLLLIQTTDRTKATENLKRLTEMIAGMLGMEWQTTAHSGVQIHSTTIPNLSLHPGYAVTDEYVLLATDSSHLEAALDCATGDTANLSTAKSFQELRAIAPKLVNNIGYANLALSLEEAISTLDKQIPDIFAEEFSDMTEEDSALIQPLFDQSIELFKKIVQILIGQIQYTVKDGEGLRSYSFLKVRDLDSDFAIADPPEVKLARWLLIARGYFENEMLNRAHLYVDQILELDAEQPSALTMKVSLLEAEGNEKRALRYRQKLGFAPETAWHIIGPFPNPDSEGFDTVYPPETSVDFEATYETESGAVAWEKRQDSSKNDGFVDFAELFDGAEWQVAYASTTVNVPEGGEVELRVGSDDDVMVWVNGIEILTNQVRRVAAPDQDRVHVSLNPGKNRVLVKVCNREGNWGFYLRFTDANQRPIQGLTYGKR